MAWGTRCLVALLLVATPVWAQDEWQTYPATGGVVPFLGLDDSSAPTQVQDGRAQDLQNVVLSASRDLRQRYGSSRVGLTLDIAGEDPQAVTGLYYTKFSDGTERILGTISSRFVRLSGSTWVSNTASGAVAITGGQNNQFVFTTAFDNVILTNDVNPPIRYTSDNKYTAWEFGGLGTDTPTAVKVVAFFKNYLLVANTVENSVEHPTRIRWSNVGEVNVWTEDDRVDIAALGGQEINCVGELYDNLYIGLTDSVYKVSLVGGDGVFQISKVTDDIGCIAKNSVQSITLTNAQNGLIFLDKDKRIYFFNGIVAQDVSALIETTMTGLSGSRLQYAVSTDTNSDYLLCITDATGSGNNLCLDLEYELGEWTKHVNINANAMAHVLDSNAQDQVYWGSDKAFVYQYEDADLRDDVGSATGTVSNVGTYSTPFQASASILYLTSGSTAMVSGELAGAPLELTSGTGSGQTNTVIYNTTSGLVVSDAWATTPDATTVLEVGAIDSFYTTKWYDFGEPVRLKHFGETYLWGDADIPSTHSIAYANDFSSDVETVVVAQSASATSSAWGSAVWGVSLWGDVDAIFRQVKVSGQGRFHRLKFSEDDPGQTFRWFGWTPLYRAGERN